MGTVTIGTPVTTSAAVLEPPFPRVATIFDKAGIRNAQHDDDCTALQETARFNMWVGQFPSWGTRDTASIPIPCLTEPNGQKITYGQYVKRQNPNQISILYFHSMLFVDGYLDSEYTRSEFTANGQNYYVDLRWMLTYAGSTLTSNINAGTTSIPVASASRFAVGDRIIIDGVNGQATTEMARITAINGNTLTVERGINAQNGKFPAVAHSSGVYVRPVAYAFGEKNVFVMNPTNDAQRSDINKRTVNGVEVFVNQTWTEFVADFLKAKFSDPDYSNADGPFLDNFVDRAIELINSGTCGNVDSNNDNVADNPGNAGTCTNTFSQSWETGVQNMASRVRTRMSELPGKDWLIVGNTGGRASQQGQYLNGGMIEGVEPDGKNCFVGTPPACDILPYYTSWMTNPRTPHTFVFNAAGGLTGSTCNLDVLRTNYQGMRYTLTLALLGDGFYAIDEVRPCFDHATAWWYDEFDAGGWGVGYLGQPLGNYDTLANGVYRRIFNNGISLSNPTNSAQTVTFSSGFPKTSYKKILGTQDPTVNNGQVVTSVTLQPRDGIILRNEDAPSPTPTLTPTPTSTPTSTATATSTATRTPTPTNTVPPGSTATNTVPPGSTATNTVPPGSTATGTPEIGAQATPTMTAGPSRGQAVYVPVGSQARDTGW